MFDTADIYGPYTNEVLVGETMAPYRDQVSIATKFGHEMLVDGTVRIYGRPDYVLRAADASLQRLGVDVIDLYYQHRVDDAVPIEETVGAMTQLVEAGKSPIPRPVGGFRADDPSGPRGAPHHRSADRILPVDPRLPSRRTA